MRTTLTIDDDILTVAKSLAKNKSVSVGKIISELARKGIQENDSRLSLKNGFPVFETSKQSKPITLEQIKKGEDDL
jgi:hypothetical protein